MLADLAYLITGFSEDHQKNYLLYRLKYNKQIQESKNFTGKHTKIQTIIKIDFKRLKHDLPKWVYVIKHLIPIIQQLINLTYHGSKNKVKMFMKTKIIFLTCMVIFFLLIFKFRYLTYLGVTSCHP